MGRKLEANIKYDSTLGLDAGATLFKFGDEKYIERTVKYGELRIGTLFDYRRHEDLGPAIGDADEGRSEV